jgi:Nuclease-related domain.
LALMAEGVSELAFAYSEETLLTCCRIATLCRMLAESNSISRWLAKGASFEHLGSGILKNVSNLDVRAAINEYERRRPGSALFTDEGIFFDPSHPSLSQFQSQHLISLGMTAPPLEQFVLEPNHAEFPISYFPLPRNRVALAALLRPYDDALQDLFGVGTESILDVLQAIGSLIIRSFLPSTEENSLSFSGSLQNDAFSKQFLFMLGICRRGYLRFPEEHLRAEIIRELSKDNPGEVLCAEETVNRFFGAFCHGAEQAKIIEVRRLEPLPILYVTAGNQCYLDLLWFNDFFRWLIVRSREWFSSQHGDRFTLAVKRLVEEQSPHSKVVGWKKTYIGSSNKQVEADLLIENNGVLYVVECKAHAKSRGFWLGELSPTRRRIQKISEAVTQVQRTTNTLAELLKGGHIPLKGIRTTEWVVCTPSQEFLLPVDRFGYLSPGIPRVCTPEELIIHLYRSK